MPGNASRLEVIQLPAEKSFEKGLTDRAYYSIQVRSREDARQRRSTLTSMTHRQHTVNRKPSARMRTAVCGLGWSLSPTTPSGNKLGFETAIVDSRYIRF
jgi:hypothetical protein